MMVADLIFLIVICPLAGAVFAAMIMSALNG